MSRISLGIIIILLLIQLTAWGQKKDWGRLGGSIETTVGFYQKDKKLQSTLEDDYGVNTWLNLNYSIDRFRFGLQYELYEPPLIGFPVQLKGNKLIQGFGEFQNKKWYVRLGNVYEQFGSGMVLRAYEERMLGLNNSILGANIRWTPYTGITLKAIAGTPRKNLDYEKVVVYGLDGEIEISELLEWESLWWSVGASWLMRDDREFLVDRYPAKVQLWSARMTTRYGVFSFDGEYSRKGNSMGFDAIRRYYSDKGSALLLNLGVDVEGVGMLLGFRRLQHMEFRIDNEIAPEQVHLNYLPSLTRQHKYTLPALYPYSVRKAGEIGGQFDLFGEIPQGILGQEPVKVVVNMALYNMPDLKENGKESYLGMKGEKMFREASIELERKWGKDFKGIISYVRQEQSLAALQGYGSGMGKSDIVLGDFLYKLSSFHSLRLELQHMWSRNIVDKAWCFGQLEYGWAPRWMFYVNDLYNYNTVNSSIHYYSGGISFTQKSFRTSLSYGRNRAGYHCVGGVCRYVPDYTGFNFSLIWIL